MGLGAAGLSFAGMAIPFTWNTFVVQRHAWDWAFATDYLHMIIQAITILVLPAQLRQPPWPPRRALACV